MYNEVKTVIESGIYELVDMLAKIDKLWLEAKLTDEQRDELVEAARGNASMENSLAPLAERLEALELWRVEVDKKLAGIEGQEPGNTEEYPEYVQPSGAHDAYNTGDKITFNGKKYECTMDGCVWSPETYPSAWRLVE